MQSLEPDIIFEDEDLLVIDKPYGYVVNKSETTKDFQTIQDWAENKLKKQISDEENTDFAARGGIVHRLDKETSGLLLIAKNNKAFTNLQSQFKERKVLKKYLVLVHGLLVEKSGNINAPIGRLPWNRERFGVFPGGRESSTDYQLLAEYQKEGEKFSLIEATPHTGRTHQIRVHFKYLNHPVVGDENYGGRKQSRKDRTYCQRQFLHAKSIEIMHPANGKVMHFETKIPNDLQLVLESLTVIK